MTIVINNVCVCVCVCVLYKSLCFIVNLFCESRRTKLVPRHNSSALCDRFCCWAIEATVAKHDNILVHDKEVVVRPMNVQHL
jgi:hypothetical protein